MSQLMSLVPIEKRMMYELKRQTPIHEWKQLQTMIGEFLGLTETEAVTDQQVEDLILKISKELKASGKIDAVPTDIDVDKLEKGDESGIQMSESKQPINEGLVGTIILASPTLLKLLAKIVDWFYRTFTMSGEEKKAWEEQKAAYDYAKKTGKSIDGKKVSDDDIHHMEDELYKSKGGKLILSASHKLHDLYVSPLRTIIAAAMYVWEDGKQGWLQSWKDAKKAANILYAIIMFAYAGWSGFHAVAEVTNMPVAELEPIAHVVVDALKGGDMSITLLKKVIGHVHV